MLVDPLVLSTDWTAITVDAAENWSFPAVERAADHSRYQNGPDAAGTTLKVFVGHQYGRRSRFTFRVDAEAIVPDVLVDNTSSRLSQSCYVVFDCPPTGPFNYGDYTSGITLANMMLHTVGGVLVSVDTADPVFQRILKGET